MPETPDTSPPPLIPRDHPMRQFYEQQRAGLLVQLRALDQALGLGEGNARRRREQARGWHNDGDVQQSA